jgi:hypothetical protein
MTRDLQAVYYSDATNLFYIVKAFSNGGLLMQHGPEESQSWAIQKSNQADWIKVLVAERYRLLGYL